MRYLGICLALLGITLGCQPSGTISQTIVTQQAPSTQVIDLAGEVLDEDGVLVPNVNVTLDSVDRDPVLHMETLSVDGKYMFGAVPVGIKVNITAKVEEDFTRSLKVDVPDVATLASLGAKLFTFSAEQAVPRERSARKRATAPSVAPSPTPTAAASAAPASAQPVALTSMAPSYTPASSYSSHAGCTWVNDYYRKDGTHVSGYWRCK